MLGGVLYLSSVSAATLVIRDETGQVVERFDDQELAALPQRSFQTATPWTDGTSSFEGPTLADLLSVVEQVPEGLTLRALNDYQVDFPMSAMMEDAPIIAFLRDGRRMSVREQGPYWLMFPFDSDPGLQQERFYSLSVWQLKEIIIHR